MVDLFRESHLAEGSFLKVYLFNNLWTKRYMYVVAKTTLTTINFYCEMYCSLNKSNSNLLAITSCSFFFVLDRQAYRLPDNDWLLSLLEVSNARVIAKAAVFLRYQNEAASWSNTSNPSTCR